MSELLREQSVCVCFSVSEHANILCKANRSKEISEVSKLANVIKSSVMLGLLANVANVNS